MGWYMASLEAPKARRYSPGRQRNQGPWGKAQPVGEVGGEDLSMGTGPLCPPRSCSERCGSPLAYVQTPTVQEQPAHTPAGPAPGDAVTWQPAGPLLHTSLALTSHFAQQLPLRLDTLRSAVNITRLPRGSASESTATKTAGAGELPRSRPLRWNSAAGLLSSLKP